MCGINGILSEDIDITRKIIPLNKLISHRGPDDEGFVCLNTLTEKSSSYSGDDTVGLIKQKYPHISSANFKNFNLVLAHRRLTIIDLSEKGHCPMKDENEKIWITYNGEIYNYIELRNELKSHGYMFRTESDTEVIIKSYLKWGEDCFTHFNGMWALAIWDNEKKKLVLSRDRFGIKPLYYTISDNYFAFSSEIKPLIYLNNHSYEINDRKIPFFLLYGNRLNTEETYLNYIHSLKPSNNLIYQENRISLKRYYNFPAESKISKTEVQLKEELVTLCTDSVKLRFRSDVPVGTCLSGGFDSSSIVAMSYKILGKGLNTFSAVWSDKECDESIYIDEVNKEFGCMENKIEPKVDEFETVFDRLSYYQEIPTEGPGLYPQWYVMQIAKKKVKVLLDGQGGDEVFGGYFWQASYLRSLITDVKIKTIFKEINSYFSFLRTYGIHSFLGWLFPGFYNKTVRGHLSRKLNIFNNDFRQSLNKSDLYLDVIPPKLYENHLNNLSFHYITNLTIPTLLHYEDRSSMAHSIESRIPFLDYRIVEFGLSLKPEHLVSKNTSRPFYRNVFKDFLPKQIVERKNKLGYPVPFANWTRNELKNMVIDILTSPDAAIFKYLDRKQIELSLNRHFKKEIDFSWDIWRLFSLEKFLGITKLVKSAEF